MVCTGPFTLADGDSQEVAGAIVIGRGASALGSVTVMKENVALARQVFANGNRPLTTTISQHSEQIPDDFRLEQNYPNPFNPGTTIHYRLNRDGFVQLRIYDLLGRKVATLVAGKQTAGEHRIEWRPEGLAGGVYFYTLQAGGFKQTRKLLLLK